MATDKPRFTLTFDDDLLAQVESYQCDHGFSTKSRAIQALLEIGLSDLLSEQQKSPAPTLLEDGDEEFLRLYHRLDPLDRALIHGEVRGLLLHDKYREKTETAAG